MFENNLFKIKTKKSSQCSNKFNNNLIRLEFLKKLKLC